MTRSTDRPQLGSALPLASVASPLAAGESLRDSRGLHDSAERKRLGIFYTPDSVAAALARWAVRTRIDRVLDPSFGGCAFFSAVRMRFCELDVPVPVSQLFGADVDPQALLYLGEIPDVRNHQANFKTADFLRLGSDAFGALMDVVVGNPPFVRHHMLSAEQVEAGQAALASAGYALPRTAGYWAYFLLHSLSFLRKGGRLAMVLPTALLSAEYAGRIRASLEARFAHLRLVTVREPMFKDAQEAGVLVLADGHREPHVATTMTVADTIDDLVRLCVLQEDGGAPISLAEENHGWRRALVNRQALDVLESISTRPAVASFGLLARVRIGVVTGANAFFVLSKARADELDVPSEMRRFVVNGAHDLRGLALTRADRTALRKTGKRTELLMLGSTPMPAPLDAYLNSAEGLIARNAYKCSARKLWYSIDDKWIPDAFLTYVNGRAPRLILNQADATCTNAVHRIGWRQRYSLPRQQLLTLSVLSSLSGLCAELFGRVSGGGALKLEPSDAARLLVAVPVLPTRDIATAFTSASNALRNRDWYAARETADNIVLRKGLGLEADEIDSLRTAQNALHDLRVATRAVTARTRRVVTLHSQRGVDSKT